MPDIITDVVDAGPYGTRTHTVVLVDRQGRIRHIEETFEASPDVVQLPIGQVPLPVPGSWQKTDTVLTVT